MRQDTRCLNPYACALRGVAAVLAVLAFWTGVAGAGEKGTCGNSAAPAQNAPAATAQAPSAEAAGQAGMRAFIDPTTGQLREPTAEEAASLNRFLVRAMTLPAAPQIVQHPNGMLSAQLGDEFMNDVVVQKNPDGTLVWRCVPHSLSETELATPAPPKGPDLEKE